MNRTRVLIVTVFAAALFLYFFLDLGRFLNLAYVQSQLDNLQAFASERPVLSSAIYFTAYVVMVTLSIPGAAIATLLGGAVFGLLWGTVLVSFASSIGATLAFLAARLVLRDWVQRRFGRYLKTVNEGVKRDGGFYLFSIRMVPLFPFWLINLVMALTPIRTSTFYIASQTGMLLGTAVYVNAGSELARISSLGGLLNATLILSFLLVALLPWLARGVVAFIKRRKAFRGFTKPKQFDTNVVVIGAGSGGLVASLIAAGAKAKVTLIERDRMGGDCLNTGCVPSKSLIQSARVAATVRDAGRFGVQTESEGVDFASVMERVQSVIRAIEPHDSVERFTSLGVDCVHGEARITSPWTVEVNGKTLRTRSIIVATGAGPLMPPIPGIDAVDPLTSDSVWSLREQPRELLVLGGGPIGSELAQSFARLGSSVTLVDMAPQVLPREDEDASAIVRKHMEADGIRLVNGYKAAEFIMEEGRHVLVAQPASGEGEALRIPFDRVLVALGRKPNVAGFGLEELGIKPTEQGTLPVNEYLQTPVPTIYACGDVCGPWQFTHMASYQAWFAALNALAAGLKKFRVRYPVVPWATFTAPEVARVGLNERDARDQGIEHEVTRFDIGGLDRALADGAAEGFVKVLTEPGSDRILGATIVGDHAGELIGEFITAMTHGLGLKKIAATNHIYPTWLEANRFAANAWRSKRLPHGLLRWSERWFRWRRG